MVLEFLVAIGASNTAGSMTSGLHTATSLKFLWSPIVDLFGRLRTWVWVMQIIVGLGMFGVASVSSHGNSWPLWVGLGTLAILLATHDIACDGFYLQALDRKRPGAVRRHADRRLPGRHDRRLVVPGGLGRAEGLAGRIQRRRRPDVSDGGDELLR